MGLLPIPAPRLTQGASRAGFWRAAALYDKRLPPPSFRLPHVPFWTIETEVPTMTGDRAQEGRCLRTAGTGHSALLRHRQTPPPSCGRQRSSMCQPRTMCHSAVCLLE